MRFYIAGRITGLTPEYAAALFAVAERKIEKAGHTPLNPMKLVDQTEGREYGEYLADALRILLTQAEAVYFLDNWIDSRGARIEHAIVQELAIPFYFSNEALPIGSDWPEQV